MRAFSQALAAMKRISFVPRPAAEAKQSDLEVYDGSRMGQINGRSTGTKDQVARAWLGSDNVVT
jgi:hypothetical protein